MTTPRKRPAHPKPKGRIGRAFAPALATPLPEDATEEQLREAETAVFQRYRMGDDIPTDPAEAAKFWRGLALALMVDLIPAFENHRRAFPIPLGRAGRKRKSAPKLADYALLHIAFQRVMRDNPGLTQDDAAKALAGKSAVPPIWRELGPGRLVKAYRDADKQWHAMAFPASGPQASKPGRLAILAKRLAPRP